MQRVLPMQRVSALPRAVVVAVGGVVARLAVAEVQDVAEVPHARPP